MSYTVMRLPAMVGWNISRKVTLIPLAIAAMSRNTGMSASINYFAAHCRGLVEKIWKVLHPSQYARSAAFSTPPAMEVWMPMRREVKRGGRFGGGDLRMSCS